jgi:uncharacterized protein
MEKTLTKEVNGHMIAAAFHDGGGKDIVIFCHGFRGASVGPSRSFVTAARMLAEKGISSLRFDQYRSGNSEGDFKDSSFNDWVATTKTIVEDYLERGYRVALFGQSMGGATVIATAAEVPDVKVLVAWSPDPNIDEVVASESGYSDEGGQLIQDLYWIEAHESNIADKLANVKAPGYIVQCTSDEFVDKANRDAISSNAQSQHVVDIREGYVHSAWTYEQFKDIIEKCVDFIVQNI